jgi:RNA polymerase sigma-70 factor, ECF subfamily
MPAEPEVAGLLALMLIQDSRRDARIDERGDMILLADQDRSLWDREEIAEGLGLIDAAMGRLRALRASAPGPYAVQAAIAAEHARAPEPGATDWMRIRRMYDWLAIVEPSPVVELNRAVAIAMSDGPERGLAAMDGIEGLESYQHYHSARADLLARLGRREESTAAYERALELASNPVEQRFLERRLQELAS